MGQFHNLIAITVYSGLIAAIFVITAMCLRVLETICLRVLEICNFPDMFVFRPSGRPSIGSLSDKTVD